MLIATILSQNTNDKNSHRAYADLRRRYLAWKDVAHARVGRIASAIRMGGMAQQKSARIKETLAEIRTRYGRYSLSALRRLPDSDVIDELTQFNGVGVKTAACVLLFSLGKDVFPVDTHVHRICNRLGLANGSKLPEHTFEMMKRLVPKGRAYTLHTNLIRFGRKVCRSQNPACDICPLYDECSYEGKQKRRGVKRPATNVDHDFMLLDNV